MTALIRLWTAIREAARCRERIKPPPAQQMRREAECLEYRNKGGGTDVEPAHIGAESRHHQPRFAIRGAFHED